MVEELITSRGLLLRRDAVASGYDDNQLARLRRAGKIVRIRQGAYASAAVWSTYDARARHQLLCDAVVRQYDDGVVLSHDSAVLRHGGPDYGLDLSSVHVTHFDGGGRRVAGVVHHQGRCGALDVTRIDDHWATSPARTVLDTAMVRGATTGMVVAEDFLHRGLTTKPELRMLTDQMKFWPGAIGLRLLNLRATGRSESVGETLGYLMFRNQRLPIPVQQFEVWYGGKLIGRTDWAWPEHRLLGEFDGHIKYVRLCRPGETAADVVVREKRREDRLREVTGWSMIRLVWSDLHRQEATAARVRAAMRRPAA